MEMTVLMSVYKEQIPDLQMAIESILHQTFREFEFLIILDDPGNELIRTLISEYAERDERIRFFVNKQNIGLVRSLNKGLMLAKTPVIARMDADDRSEPERLEKEFDFLQVHPEYAVVSVNRTEMDENSQPVAHETVFPEGTDKVLTEILLHDNVITHPGVMFRKADVMELGGYRDIYAAEDYDLWLRMLAAGKKIHMMNERLICYRVRTEGISGSNAMVQRFTTRFIRKEYKKNQKTGKDSFDADLMKQFLERKCSKKRQKRYISANHFYQQFWHQRSVGENAKSIGSLIRAVVIHGETLSRLYDVLYVKRIMKRVQER